MSAEESFSRFQEFCEQFPGLWNSLDIRVATIQAHDREVVLHLVMRLDPRVRQDIRPPLYNPSVAGYDAWHMSRPFDELERILAGLQEGVLELEGRLLHVGRVRNDTFGDVNWSLTKHTRGARNEPFPRMNLASAMLYAWGDNLGDLSGDHDLAEELEHRWRSLPAPFMDERDVLGSYFGAVFLERYRIASWFQVEAPIPIYIDEHETTFSDDRLIVAVQAPSETPRQDLRVGVVANDGERRFSLTATDAESRTGGRHHPYRLIATADELAHAVLYLQYKGMQVDELSLWNPRGADLDPIAEVHQYFDPDRRVLHKRLFGDEGSGKPPRNFDVGVAWLFGLCGMSPIVYEGSGVQDEIDLVAHVPEFNTFVCIECTVGGPGKDDKMDKLHKRCRDIEDNTSATVQPVLATAWSEQAVPDDVRTAARLRGVALLASEQLKELEELGLRRASKSRVLELLRDSVPTEPDSPLGLLGGMRPS